MTMNLPVVISTWSFGLPANEAAWRILSTDGRALDAVEAGVRVSESDPRVSTVGYGGAPDRDGNVTLDASIMDDAGNCGSVVCLKNILHPVTVARMVMERTPHAMLVGDGALQFAIENGFHEIDLLTPASKAAWLEWRETSKFKTVANIENHDTIGMIAIDIHGNLSGACTTSGLAYKMPGRVGDSPIVGAGLFVDNEIGAATATGLGEEVIRTVGSFLVVELMRQGHTPEQACRLAVERIARKHKSRRPEVQVGFVALNKQGLHGAHSLEPGFNYAICSGAQANHLIDSESLYK
jgi:N4-(beta-N-acetylglucosaminyl)-L-asparaginase